MSGRAIVWMLCLLLGVGPVQAAAQAAEKPVTKPTVTKQAAEKHARTAEGTQLPETTGQVDTKPPSVPKPTPRVRVRSSVAVIDPKGNVQDIISQLRRRQGVKPVDQESAEAAAVELRPVQRNPRIAAGVRQGDAEAARETGTGRGLNRNDRLDKVASHAERRLERVRARIEARAQARARAQENRGRRQNNKNGAGEGTR